MRPETELYFMRIALIRKVCSLKKAGAERYCVNLFRQLQASGHQVTVIGESIDDDLRDEVEFVSVKVRRTTSWSKNLSFARNALDAAYARSFDIVHSLSRVPGVDTFRLTDPLQAHWLKVFYRGLTGKLQQLNPRHRTLLGLERQIYQGERTRRIIVQSTLDARLIQQYYGVLPEKIRLVRNGVDLQKFQPGSHESRCAIRRDLGVENEPLLVFAAMDFRRKGLDCLLESLSKLSTRTAKLLVLGDGNIPAYERLAQRFGVADRVIFAGRQQGMAAYYAAADLFVLPTIYEPFPNVNLEAMACGTPVITTASAGGVDLVDEGRNGYLISSGFASEELAEKIDLHCALPEIDLRRMSDSCIETARQFTVERNARESLGVFEEVLDERRKHPKSQAA